MRQKGTSALIIVILIVLAGATGYFGYQYFKSRYQITPISSSTPTATPTNSPAAKQAQTGTVSGKLCFPSSFVPPGVIVAKDSTSGKKYSQNYAGTMAGAKLNYSFDLPIGTYHLRFEAHASTTKPEVFTSGYYDECAKTMAVAECTPDSGHIIIPITVTKGVETTNVDLCDFYYNPAQMQSLDASF